jgi:hypothetical protein
LNSSFLIRTIVIAERFSTLRKAREILLHPYFSKHVTHLLWDASYYEERIAANYRAYEDDYLYSNHTLKHEDKSHRQNREADALLQWQLRSAGPSAPKVYHHSYAGLEACWSTM